MDLSNKEKLNQLFKDRTIDIVINLAAQAGVRYSIENWILMLIPTLLGLSISWRFVDTIT